MASIGRKRTAQAQEVMDTERVFDLDLRDRGNLDEEKQTLVDGIVKKHGFMPNFLKLFATDNQRMRAFVTPYLELLRTDSGLNQLDHEMIALVSATTNGCNYCCAHHGALMRGESGDPMFAEHLSRNYKLADLSPRHLAMLDFVVKVLKDAEHIDHDDRQALSDVGFDDEAIWTIVSTAAFYAGANRVAQAVGLKITPQYLDMNRA